MARRSMSRMTLTVPRPRYRARVCASLCLRHDLAIRHAQACDRGRVPHGLALEFGGFDSEFTLEPCGDQLAMTPGAAGFDLPAALPAAEDRRRAVTGKRA